MLSTTYWKFMWIPCNVQFFMLFEHVLKYQKLIQYPQWSIILEVQIKSRKVFTINQKANKLPANWPWRQKDIKTGDFQRTYNKICLQFFDDSDVFKDHQNFNCLSFTWEFQYQNLLLTEEGKKDFNKKSTYFRNYNGQNPLIFGVMLAITGHWTLFLAFKQGNKTEYWYFDSKNRLSLDMNQADINRLIQDLNKEMLKRDKKSGLLFKNRTILCAFEIPKLVSGRQQIVLKVRQQFKSILTTKLQNIFAKPIEKIHQLQCIKQTQRVLKQYWHNIGSFFSRAISWNLLNEESKSRMKLLFQISKQMKNETYYGNHLFNFINKSSGKF